MLRTALQPQLNFLYHVTEAAPNVGLLVLCADIDLTNGSELL